MRRNVIGEFDDEHPIHTTYEDILSAAPSTDELDNFFGSLKGMLDDAEETIISPNEDFHDRNPSFLHLR